MDKKQKQIFKLVSDPDIGEANYVYALCDEDQIFYIGKGRLKRWRQHFYKLSLEKPSYKNHKIKSIVDQNKQVIVKIIAKGLSEDESLTLEAKLIDYYGTCNEGGLLTNVYYGKVLNGRTRYVMPEYARKKISLAQRGSNSTVNESLVYKAKLLVHYRGMSYKEVSEQPGFEACTQGQIKQWLNNSGNSYSYVAPHLKNVHALRKEKKEECYDLYKKGWSRKQIQDILGLDKHFVKKVIRESLDEDGIEDIERASLVPLVKKAKCLFNYRGMTYNEIINLPEFKAAGITYGRVLKWLNREEFPEVLPHLKTFYEIIDEQREECFNLRQKGFSTKQVGEILGLPEGKCQRYIKQYKDQKEVL